MATGDNLKKIRWNEIKTWSPFKFCFELRDAYFQRTEKPDQTELNAVEKKKKDKDKIKQVKAIEDPREMSSHVFIDDMIITSLCLTFLTYSSIVYNTVSIQY